MGWNGSSNAGTAAIRAAAAEPQRRPSRWRGAAVGLAVVMAGAVAAWLAFPESGSSDTAKPTDNPKPVRQAIAQRPPVQKKRAESNGEEHVRERLEEVVSDNVKDFIKKAATNKVQWLKRPIDPDDPDRALMNRVCAEIGTLLASEPGDVMIPWPYTFLDEDDAKARGMEVKGDGGTKEFLDSLNKYRIAVKDGDSEERIAYKEKLVAAQAELLEGIAAGMSVNDSIRAAYEFRKHAYELRSTAIKTMREFLEAGDTVENTRDVLKAMNEKLKEEGIRTISEEDIGIESEDDSENDNTGEGNR